jgi:hypothetical protein
MPIFLNEKNKNKYSDDFLNKKVAHILHHYYSENMKTDL